jgi:transposase
VSSRACGPRNLMKTRVKPLRVFNGLSHVFDPAATRASCGRGPFRDFYAALLAKGMKPEMARLTLARKIAAITLTLWKKEERFDAEPLKTQAA